MLECTNPVKRLLRQVGVLRCLIKCKVRFRAWSGARLKKDDGHNLTIGKTQLRFSDIRDIQSPNTRNPEPTKSPVTGSKVQSQKTEQNLQSWGQVWEIDRQKIHPQSGWASRQVQKPSEESENKLDAICKVTGENLADRESQEAAYSI